MCDLSSGNVMENLRGEACREARANSWKTGHAIVHQHCVTSSVEVFQMIGRSIDGWAYREAKEEPKSNTASYKHKIYLKFHLFCYKKVVCILHSPS